MIDHLRLSVAAFCLAQSWGMLARAQVFSPGELATPHEKLEGLRNCTKCHEAGQKLANVLCIDCHREVGATITAKRGLHGRASVSEKSCASCHHEHLGREHELVDWGGDVRRFDHERAGYALRGGHAKVDCKGCHDERLITDAAVKKLVRRTGKTTYLGLPTACASCHFDEHRGQVGERCQDCHDESDWKKTPRFDHDDTDYRLIGKHARVACEKCHPRERDGTTPAEAFPAPVSRTFLRLDGIAHGSCLDCHKDVHDGAFGRDCASCHSPKGWSEISGRAKTAEFHEKTRFPLRGGHRDQPCKACHGPARGRPAVFKGLPFESCAPCHADAHVGQLGEMKGARGATCDRCHTVEAFSPATYGADEHAKADYALEGAHRAVPCDRCHERDATLAARFPAALRKKLADYGRKPALSAMRFQLDEATRRCDTCHRDVHLGQLAERLTKDGCEGCHVVSSFSDVRFDHDRDARFKLAGKHAGLPCGDCHERRTIAGSKEQAVLYRPLATDCAACHADVHAGQFAATGTTTTDCSRCHDAAAFAPARFDHDDPAQSRFPLRGKHAQARCDGCHTKIEVDAETLVTRYRPLPERCSECHVDYHSGAYAGPRITELLGVSKDASASTGSPCEVCHSVDGWPVVHFAAHDETGFPLRGAHAGVPCGSCHGSGHEKPTLHSCTSCHRDPHAGELGEQCGGCHTPEDWRGAFDVLAHHRTGFPLFGRHAIIPCQECHPAQTRGFGLATLQCIDCHAADYARTALTSIDHAAAGFSTDCLSCHDAWRFSPGRFPEHDRCFAISRGEHAGVRCRDCHTSVSSFTITGACNTMSASCTMCHEHRCAETDEEHEGVPGYQCRDRKCYECHRMTSP